MSVSVTFNGSTYVIPTQGDTEWATSLTAFLQALASGALGKKGGTLTPVATGTVLTIIQPDGSGRCLVLGFSDGINAPVRVTPRDTDPDGPNLIGDIYVTAAGVLKICTVAGTPGTFVSVGSQS